MTTETPAARARISIDIEAHPDVKLMLERYGLTEEQRAALGAGRTKNNTAIRPTAVNALSATIGRRINSRILGKAAAKPDMQTLLYARAGNFT